MSGAATAAPFLRSPPLSASRYNLVENGDFRVSSGWTKNTNCTTSDTYFADTGETAKAAAPQLDTNYFKMTGSTGKIKNIQQTVTVSGIEGDSFVFAGWAKGYSAPLDSNDSNERKFAVRARFHYTDGTKSDYFSASFNPSVQQWQYSAAACVAKKEYNAITVALVYDYNINTVYFDGIQLFKEEFGTSYTYDEDGNVVSSVDLQKKNTTYEYNTNGDVTKILEDNKAKVTYTYYENSHNVKTAKTEEGLKYTFTYDGYGNNTSVSIGDGDTKITSSATYTANGNYTASTTDALGKTTAYTYDTDTGVLLSVQYPEDEYTTKVNEVTGETEVEIDTRTKYDYDSMFRAASAVCDTDTDLHMSATYTYDDDYLESVATPTTTYGFTYGDFGLREKVKAGNNTLATYHYTEDENHYLKSLDYGNGDSVEYEYDKKGRVETETYEDGDTVRYLYNNDGNLAKVIDSATGRTTTYFYDLLDRMVKYEETCNKWTREHPIDPK